MRDKTSRTAGEFTGDQQDKLTVAAPWIAYFFFDCLGNRFAILSPGCLQQDKKLLQDT